MPEAALEKRTQEKKQNPNHKANTLPQKNELQKITKKCILKQNPSSKNPFTLFFCFFAMLSGQHQLRGELKSFPPFFPEQLSPVPWCNNKSLQQRERSELTFPTKREKTKKSSTQKCHFFLGDMLFPTRVATEHVTFLCPKRAFVGCFFLPIGTACFTPPKGLKNKNMRQKLPNRGFFTE